MYAKNSYTPLLHCVIQDILHKFKNLKNNFSDRVFSYYLKNMVIELMVTVARKDRENRLEVYSITYTYVNFCRKKLARSGCGVSAA